MHRFRLRGEPSFRLKMHTQAAFASVFNQGNNDALSGIVAQGKKSRLTLTEFLQKGFPSFRKSFLHDISLQWSIHIDHYSALVF